MTILDRILHALHIKEPPAFDDNDLLNAEAEDKQRDHQSLVAELATTLVRREELNSRLRESIKIARKQTNSFADFESLTNRRREQG